MNIVLMIAIGELGGRIANVYVQKLMVITIAIDLQVTI